MLYWNQPSAPQKKPAKNQQKTWTEKPWNSCSTSMGASTGSRAAAWTLDSADGLIAWTRSRCRSWSRTAKPCSLPAARKAARSIPEEDSFRRVLCAVATVPHPYKCGRTHPSTTAHCPNGRTRRIPAVPQPPSFGDTFWVPSDAEPRCALEQIALSIFELHAAPAKATGLCACARVRATWIRLFGGARLRYRSLSPPGRLNGPLSGAEWWTLVIDESDEVCGPSAARAAFTVRHTRFHLGRLPLGQGLPCRGGARSECVSTHCNGHVSLDIPSLDCLTCEHFDAHRSDPSDDGMDAQHW